jgi:hypothetical protein
MGNIGPLEGLKFEKYIIPVLKGKIGLKMIYGWATPYLYHVIHSGVASTRRKIVNTAAWHGNFAITVDKHPVGITLNANSHCCINFQNLTLDFIFLCAHVSYLVMKSSTVT